MIPCYFVSVLSAALYWYLPRSGTIDDNEYRVVRPMTVQED